TALARAFSRWTGARSLLVDLEGHGREEIAEDLDISRTVGWFTSISPVWLDLQHTDTPGEALAAVKEQLGQIPNRGIGYGLLRYLHNDFAATEELRLMPRAEVSFNYLGQTGQMFNEASLLKVLIEPIGPVIAPTSPMPHLVYVAGIIFEAQLYMRFKYSKDCFHPSTIETLAQSFREELRGLIAYCQSAEAGKGPTFLFPLAHLDGEELAMALKQVGTDDGEGRVTAEQVEDVYPLSPSQEGILFHSIYAPQSGVYVIQMHCTFRGLNVSATEHAWQALLERHSILRSAFAWEDVVKPLQIVVRSLKMPWQRLDWRELSASGMQERFQAYLDEDRNRGFNLSNAPLMRFSLIRTADNDYKFVWSHHHLLLDGWSIFIILKEFCALYDAYVKGEIAQLEPTQSYGDYISWVRKHDPDLAEPFWRELLAGFSEPTPVGRQSDSEPGHAVRHGEHRGLLPEAAMSSLQAFARQQQLTLNTVVQAAWAMLLSHRSGMKDVVFGATASGRPPELPGIEEMVGIFINVVPMRIKLDSGEPVSRWLKKIQERQFKVRQYEYSPLVQIQRWSEVPRGRPLFQSILSFENYPIDSSISEYASSLDISDVYSTSRTNYPMTVIVAPRKEMVFRFVYDRDRFEEGAIEEMAAHFESILRAFVEHPEASVGAIEEMLAKNESDRRASDQRTQEEAKRNRLKKIKPVAVRLPKELVKLSYLTESKLPLVIEPAVDDADLADWAAHNRQFIETELHRHGALLLRGFKVDGVEKFQQAAAAICPELFGEYGDLPREGVNGKVYGSTPYPSTQTILYHNESSHMHRWPLKIWFYCVQAALQGGETPVVDCRQVFRRLDPQIRERFARKRLMYVRNYVEGLDVSWQSFFRTKDKSEVEKYCRSAGIEFTWVNNDGLRTRKVCAGLAKHPRTGEMVFFNQVQLHHASCLDPAVRETLGAMFSEPEFPRNVYYGDGSPIEDSVISEISELYRETSVSFPWRERDILMLDNMLVAHARNPYVGPRRIVVAMGELLTEAEFEAS
ncbi:MAG TPA: condensation domain-containing protein, partial [Blastocatellia bacterium]